MKRVFICVCLVIVLYSCKSGNSGSPKNTISSFIEASREGNITEVKKYITRSDVSLMEIGENLLAKFDPDGTKGMKDKMMKEFKDKTKDAKVEIKDEKIEGENATVNVEFTNNGKTETRPFSLIKEDGKWKISLVSTGMKNSGSKQKDIEEVMKNINIDSLKGSISEGMGELDKLNKDSLKKEIEEGMKEVEKLKDNPKKN
jgi:Domain of unknown function (DUF4878)